MLSELIGIYSLKCVTTGVTARDHSINAENLKKWPDLYIGHHDVKSSFRANKDKLLSGAC